MPFSSCPADVVLVNAQILSCDVNSPFAREVAIGGGKVLRLGYGLLRDQALARGARVVDCRGSTVLPGFVDAHLHFSSYADSLLCLNLRPSNGVRSIAQIQAVLKREAENTPQGQWLRGKGYNEFYFKERRHPTRWDLNAVAPHHPVKLTHRSHHAHVLNSLALELVGIDRNTPDPSEGLIERDTATGEPTGLLFEMGALLARRVPHWHAETFAQGVERAAQQLASVGITTFLDASPIAEMSRLRVFQDYRAKGLIRQRVVTMVGRDAIAELDQRDVSFGNNPDEVSVWGVKIILDRTSGDLRPDQKELNQIVREVQGRGWPVAIHAVEEETVEAALNAMESSAPATGHPGNQRHRIEHGSVCPPHLARRMAALGVTVTTQPSFVYYHGERYLNSVDPKQLPHLYPLATWLRSGVPVALSSDCPLVPPSPLMAIYASTTRRTQSGAVLSRGQKVRVGEALVMHTIQAARAVGLASSVGSLTPGKKADIVVMSRNPLTTPPEGLKDIEVQLTIVGGEIIWMCKNWE
jgi:hypothetical protein